MSAYTITLRHEFTRGKVIFLFRNSNIFRVVHVDICFSRGLFFKSVLLKMVEVAEERKRKTNYCRRNKKNWRKFISTKEVDEFLDDQRREERIGRSGFKDKKNDDLFVIDTNTNEVAKRLETAKLSKKERALLPPTCLKFLSPLTAVPDPITKRNRVRTKEERKCSVRKCFDGYKRSLGIIPKKERESLKQRSEAIQNKAKQPKEHIFNKNIWDETEGDEIEKIKSNEWLNEETIRHTLTNTSSFKVRVPKGIVVKKSIIPPIEAPHPGMSYNPSYEEHNDLLKIVEEKERERLKEEAHIKRVTTDAFNKISSAERDKIWFDEMTEGLVKKEEDKDDAEQTDISALPKAKPKPKTQRQKRRQKELRREALMRKYAKVEKKKTADIYKLRFIKNDLDKKEESSKLNQEKKKKRAILNQGKTKRLASKAFEEPDLDFNRVTDLRGNLRNVKREGNLLLDRFYSLQKRNILPPTDKKLPPKKAKVKKFVKPSHVIDDVKKISNK